MFDKYQEVTTVEAGSNLRIGRDNFLASSTNEENTVEVVREHLQVVNVVVEAWRENDENRNTRESSVFVPSLPCGGLGRLSRTS